jgi:hypothetical protein
LRRREVHGFACAARAFTRIATSCPAFTDCLRPTAPNVSSRLSRGRSDKRIKAIAASSACAFTRTQPTSRRRCALVARFAFTRTRPGLPNRSLFSALLLSRGLRHGSYIAIYECIVAFTRTTPGEERKRPRRCRLHEDGPDDEFFRDVSGRDAFTRATTMLNETTLSKRSSFHEDTYCSRPCGHCASVR